MLRHIQASLLFLFSLILTAVLIRSLSGTISVSTNVTGTELPITSVQTSERELSLTFQLSKTDWDPGELLQVLETHQISATFFITENWALQCPDRVRELCEAGQELGILADARMDFSSMEEEEICSCLQKASREISRLSGTIPEFFCPAEDTWNPALIQAASRLGLSTVTWNVDSQDWKDYGTQAAADTVWNHPDLFCGSIIRFHADAKYTAQALELLLPSLEEEDYSCVPLSELLYREDFYLDAGGRQIPAE